MACEDTHAICHGVHDDADAGAAEPQPEPEPEPEAGALPEGVPVVDEPNQQVIMQAGDFLRNGSYSYHSMKHELIAIFGKEEFDKSKVRRGRCA